MGNLLNKTVCFEEKKSNYFRLFLVGKDYLQNFCRQEGVGSYLKRPNLIKGLPMSQTPACSSASTPEPSSERYAAFRREGLFHCSDCRHSKHVKKLAQDFEARLYYRCRTYCRGFGPNPFDGQRHRLVAGPRKGYPAPDYYPETKDINVDGNCSGFKPHGFPWPTLLKMTVGACVVGASLTFFFKGAYERLVVPRFNEPLNIVCKKVGVTPPNPSDPVMSKYERVEMLCEPIEPEPRVAGGASEPSAGP